MLESPPVKPPRAGDLDRRRFDVGAVALPHPTDSALVHNAIAKRGAADAHPPRLNYGTLLENIVVLETTRICLDRLPPDDSLAFASAFAMPPLTQTHRIWAFGQFCVF